MDAWRVHIKSKPLDAWREHIKTKPLDAWRVHVKTKPLDEVVSRTRLDFTGLDCMPKVSFPFFLKFKNSFYYPKWSSIYLLLVAVNYIFQQFVFTNNVNILILCFYKENILPNGRVVIKIARAVYSILKCILNLKCSKSPIVQ